LRVSSKDKLKTHTIRFRDYCDVNRKSFLQNDPRYPRSPGTHGTYHPIHQIQVKSHNLVTTKPVYGDYAVILPSEGMSVRIRCVNDYGIKGIWTQINIKDEV